MSLRADAGIREAGDGARGTARQGRRSVRAMGDGSGPARSVSAHGRMNARARDTGIRKPELQLSRGSRRTFVALALAAAIPLGLLSWYLIERPMLRFRPGPGGARPEPDAIPAAAPALGA